MTDELRTDDLVELGVASLETKGADLSIIEPIGFFTWTGVSEAWPWAARRSYCRAACPPPTIDLHREYRFHAPRHGS